MTFVHLKDSQGERIRASDVPHITTWWVSRIGVMLSMCRFHYGDESMLYIKQLIA